MQSMINVYMFPFNGLVRIIVDLRFSRSFVHKHTSTMKYDSRKNIKQNLAKKQVVFMFCFLYIESIVIVSFYDFCIANNIKPYQFCSLKKRTVYLHFIIIRIRYTTIVVLNS